MGGPVTAKWITQYFWEDSILGKRLVNVCLRLVSIKSKLLTMSKMADCQGSSVFITCFDLIHDCCWTKRYHGYSNRMVENQIWLQLGKNSGKFDFFHWIRSTALMEAYFPRKALPMHRSLFALIEVYRLRELWSPEHFSVWQWLSSILLLTRTRSGCTTIPLLVTSWALFW